MNSLTPAAAAASFRRIVIDLSARSTLDPGALADALLPERAAALAARLEALGDRSARGVETHDAFGEDDIATIDSWIRIADSMTLSDDVTESEQRKARAAELRTIRALVAPSGPLLTEDPREA